MKKIFTILGLSLGTIGATLAQVAIENNVPSFGTNYTLYQISSTITEATPGANQTWDFGAVTKSALISYSIVDPSTLPTSIKDSVPTATWAEKINLGTPEQAPYAFYENKTTHYVKIGTKSSGNNPVEKTYDTAMVFGHTFDSIIFYNRMYRHYCGYGTLMIAGKTYNNVAMFKYWATGATTDTNVQFFQFAPQWQILMSYANMNGTISLKYYWEPTASSNGVTEISQSKLSVFPNPACDMVKLQLTKVANKSLVSVYDLAGKCVMQTEAAYTNSIDLSVQQLPAGMYTIAVQSDGEWMHSKVAVQ